MCIAIPLISVSITILFCILAAIWSIICDKKFRKMKYASKIERDDEGRWVMRVYVRCGILEDYDWCWCATFNQESEAIKAQEKWKEYVEKFCLDK